MRCSSIRKLLIVISAITLQMELKLHFVKAYWEKTYILITFIIHYFSEGCSRESSAPQSN